MARSATTTMRAPGKKPISFKRGALHEQLGVPQGEPIPPGKKAAALRGEYGPKAKKRASFAFKGPLKKGRETVAAHGAGRKRKRVANPVDGASVSGTGGFIPPVGAGTPGTPRRVKPERGPSRDSAMGMSTEQLRSAIKKGGNKFRY